MKKKGKIIFSIIGVAMIAVGVVFAILSTPKKSNKEVFTDALESAFGFKLNDENISIGNKINELTNTIDNNIYKITLNFNGTMEEASSGNANATLYLGKGGFYGTLTDTENDVTHNVEALYKDNKFYFTSKDALSKYYYIDNLQEMIPTTEFTKYEKTINKVLNYLKESVIDSINDEEVVKSDDEITINSKDYKVTKYEYNITGNTLYSVLEKFLNNIKNDQEITNLLNDFVEKFSSTIQNSVNEKFTGFDGYNETENNNYDEVSKPDFKAVIDELLESAKETKKLGDLLTLSAYTYKDDTVRTEITINMETGGQKIPMKITSSNMTNDGLSYRKISLSQAGMEAGSLVVNQTSKTNYDIKLNVMNEEYVTGNLTVNGDTYVLKINSTDALPTTFNFELNISKNNGSLILSADGLKVQIDFTYEEVQSMPEIDLSNSAPYTEMTDEEKETLKGLFDFNIPNFGYQDNSVNNNLIPKYGQQYSLDDWDYNWEEFDDLMENNEDLAF